MIERLIEVSTRNSFIVLLVTAIFIAAGVYALRHINLDAIPDLSDVQVIVLTEYAGQAPQVVEDQVTYPLTTAMLSVPYAKVVRGFSFFGFSLVYIIFEDGTDLYWARSRVLEYLNFVAGRLPAGVTPQLGPDATGLGWVFQYTVEDTSGNYDLAQLRSIQDWYLRYELTSVPGVAEVASVGGFVKQYQVEVDPDKLVAYGVPLSAVRRAIKRSNSDVGGRVIEMAETEFMTRGLGYIKSIEDLETIPLGVSEMGTPIYLKNVANVHLGPEIRRGLTDKNGRGEVVTGIVVMRFGENALKLIRNVKKKLKELEVGLPPGVKIVPSYDRSGLIVRAVRTLQEKLIELITIVSLICILFLFHLRSALVAIITLPIAILMSLLMMYYFNISSNIMSLGGIAIAIGTMVDSSLVMIENANKRLERATPGEDRVEVILAAAKEVGKPLFFSLLIIAVSFVPVFTLEAQEGRLFKPLAYTKTLAMFFAALLSVTLVPVLMQLLIRGRIVPEERNPVNRLLLRVYRPIGRIILERWRLVLAVALGVVLVTVPIFRRLGSEFMPPLYEGDLLYMPTTDPGISITKARELLQQTDRIIVQFPEVDHVLGKIGRAETATDPAPLSMIETWIILKPEKEWRPGMTPDKLVDELNRAVQFPGLTNAWTMPIKTRIDMLSTGIKTPVGIKIMGDDLATLGRLAEQVSLEVRKIPGTLSAFPEKTTGGNYLDFEIDRKAAARYGLTVGDVQDVIMSAIGGMNVTYTVEGLERYPVNLRYKRELRDNIDALRRVLVATKNGARIPITQVADIKIKKGPPAIKSENARKTAWVFVDLRGVDVGTYVRKAQQVVAEKIKLPAGYSIVWSGQYEYMQRAKERLTIVVPLTILIVFFLLYMNFRSVIKTCIILLSIPFSMVGSVWLMAVLGYNLSVAVWVGIIALLGVSAEVGSVMIVFLDIAYEDRVGKGTLNNLADLREMIMEGAVERVRPLLMTVGSTVVGLLPIMWSRGTGADVMKRIASPMVGGMITATILVLIVIPVIYYLWRAAELKKRLPGRSAAGGTGGLPPMNSSA